MTAPGFLGVIVAVLASACGGDRSGAAPGGGAAGVQPTTADPVVAEPTSKSASAASDAGARPPVCDDLLARFEREEKAASRACTTASDCECYAQPEPPCSPMDAARSSSAQTLRRITNEYSEAKCHPVVACAPRLCKLECRAGRCENDR